MSQPSTPPSVYQLRVVLRGISPLIGRRLLVRSDTCGPQKLFSRCLLCKSVLMMQAAQDRMGHHMERR